MDYPYPASAEQLVCVYCPDAEFLGQKYDFGDLYDIACERDEKAAERLTMSCQNTEIPQAYYPYMERLIRVYCPDAMELCRGTRRDFGDLWVIACRRDEKAAEALRLSCEGTELIWDIPMPDLLEVV